MTLLCMCEHCKHGSISAQTPAGMLAGKGAHAQERERESTAGVSRRSALSRGTELSLTLTLASCRKAARSAHVELSKQHASSLCPTMYRSAFPLPVHTGPLPPLPPPSLALLLVPLPLPLPPSTPALLSASVAAGSTEYTTTAVTLNEDWLGNLQRTRTTQQCLWQMDCDRVSARGNFD